MRDYVTLKNCRNAAALSAVVSAMAVPRILLGGVSPGILIPAAFLTMMFVAGAATAWSRKAGMEGLLRDPRRTLTACGAAALAAFALIPLQHIVLEPIFREALAASGDDRWMDLQFPGTMHGWLALVLWSAGFQTLFLDVGPVCLFARLTNRRSAAVALTVAVHVLVVLRQMAVYGVESSLLLLLGSAAVESAMSCVLFVKGGLLPTMIFSAGLQVHHLWPAS